MSNVVSLAGRQRDIAVQLNTRVSLETRDLIDEVVEREGIKIREVIEQAIDSKWGRSGQ